MKIGLQSPHRVGMMNALSQPSPIALRGPSLT